MKAIRTKNIIIAWSLIFKYNEISADGIPPDGTISAIQMDIEKPLTVVMYILALLGIILATSCMAFIIIWREKRFCFVCQS